MRALVVCYSLTGNTRAAANAIAKELGADVEEIRCGRYAGGGWGYLRAAIDSWRGKLPEIEAPLRSPADYDVLAIGGPVWAGHLAPPVRAWLARERLRLSNAGFFVTLGGAGAERAIGEMRELAGAAPAATLAVREQDVKEGKFGAAVSSFVSALRKEKSA